MLQNNRFFKLNRNQSPKMELEDGFESIVNDTIQTCEEAVEAAEIKGDVNTNTRTKMMDVYVITKLSQLLSFIYKYGVLLFVNVENGSEQQSSKILVTDWLLRSPIGPVRSLRRLYISKEEDTNSNYLRFFVYLSTMFFSLFCNWSQTFLSLIVLIASLSLSGHNRVEKVVIAGKIVPLSVQVAFLFVLALPMFYKFDFAVPLSCALITAFTLTAVSYTVSEFYHKASK